MKILWILLIATATVTVTARHRKEWQRVDPDKLARERPQTFYKSEKPACTRGAGFYRDPQDCHQFIRCVDEFGTGRHFSVYVGRCEPGLVFDENVSSCNWPELAAPCSNSPEKLREGLKPIRPEQVPEQNEVSEETNWNKPYPLQEQVVKILEDSNTFQQVPVIQAIQVGAQEPIHQSQFEEPSEDKQNLRKPVEEQIQKQVYEEHIQTPEILKQVVKEYPQSPEIQQEVYQEHVETVAVKDENIQDNESFKKLAQKEQTELLSEHQDHGENQDNDETKIDQGSSSSFQQIVDQEVHHFEISQQAQQDEFSQQETQTEWWIPRDNLQDSAQKPVELMPASSSNNHPVFCSQEGFYRHPENCSQFIRCVKIEREAFAVHLFECPNHLTFDEKDSACVVADDESCRSKIRQKRQASNTKLRCKGEGFFRHPKDCRAFYRCTKTPEGFYETHHFSCPASLVFDEEYTTCNWPDKAPPCDTQQEYKPTKKPIVVAQTRRTTQKPQSRVTSKSNRSTAKPNSQSRTTSKSSRPSATPKPQSRTTSKTSRSSATPKPLSRTTSKSSRPVATPKPQSRTTKKGVKQSVTPRNQYRATSKVSRRSTTPMPKSRPTNKGSKLSAQKPQPRTTNKGSKSTAAYKPLSRTTSKGSWSNRKSWSTTKPRNDVFDKSIAKEVYNKRSSTARPRSTSKPYKNDVKCRNPGFFRNRNDCRKFFKCVRRGNSFVRYEISCPQNFGYDEKSQKCIAQRYVALCNRNKPPYPPKQDDEEGTTSSETSSSSSKCKSKSNNDCEKEGYFRNPEDCHKFYRCVDYEGDGKEFTRYDFDCPEGLVFDEENSVCNWPEDSAPCDNKKDEKKKENEENDSSDCEESDDNGNDESGSENGNDESGSENGNDESDSENGENESTTESMEDTNSSDDGNGDENGSDYESGEPESDNETEDSGSDNEPSDSGSDNESGDPEAENDDESESENKPDDSGSENDAGGSDNDSGESESDNQSGDSGSDNECTKEGYYRDPDDCNKFYRCVDFEGDGKEFTRYDFKCPEGLVFDEKNSVCNWPEDSEPCDTRSGGDKNENGEEGTDSTTSSSSDEGDKSSEDNEDSSQDEQTTPSNEESSESNSDNENDTEESEGTTDASESNTSDNSQSSNDDDSGSTTDDAENTTESSDNGSTSNSSKSDSGENKKECKEEGYFRDPDDCNKFYRCVDFKGDGQSYTRYDFECAEGLVFDEVNQVCNWPETTGCETKSGSGGSETTDSDGESTESQTESSTEQSESSTEESQDSTDEPQSSTSESESSSDQGESTTEETTQSSTNQDTQDSSESSTERTTEQGTSDSSTTESSSECEEPGFYRCKDDCNKFYRCVEEEDGKLVRYDFKCPDGLIFDEENKKCDYPSSDNTCDTESSTTESSTDSQTSGSDTETSEATESSGTTSSGDDSSTTDSSGTTSSGGDSSTTESSTQSSDSTTDSSDECTEEGFYRDPEDCSKYYRCVDNGDGTFTKEKHSCAEDEVFDEEMRYCNRKDLAPPCDDSQTTSSDSQTTSSDSQTTSSDSQTTSSDSETTSSDSQTTSSDSQTSSESTTDESESTSKGTTSSEQSATESSTKSGDNSECEEEGFHRCKDDCNKFYRCVEDEDGKLVRYDFKCPDGLIFDEEKEKCDYPSSDNTCDTESSTTESSTDSQTSGTSSTEDSQSSETSSTSDSNTSDSSSDSTTSSGTTSSDECTEEGFFRDPDDCRKYYRCSDEGDGNLKREDFECEEDEVFDEEMRYCNRKDLAPPCDGESSTTESSSSTTSRSSDEDSESSSSDSTTSTTEEQSSDSTSSDSTTSSTEEQSSDSTSSDSTTSSTDESSESTTSSDSTDEQGSESTTSSGNSTNSGECEEEGFHRDPNDCSKFYRCVDFKGDGQSYTRYDFECPDGLVFDETNDVCNWPSSVPECESKEGSKDSTDSSSSSDGNDKDSSESSDSSTTDSGDQSSDDQSSTSDETNTSSSDNSDSTSSQGESSSDSNESTTSSSNEEKKSGSNDDIECTEEGYFRHPDDCSKFYRCVDFKGDGQSYTRYDFECPDGLHFDEVNQVCNWPTQTPGCESGSRNSGKGDKSENNESDDNSSTDDSNNSESSTSDSSSDNGGDSSQNDSSTTSQDQTTQSSSGSKSSGESECEKEGFSKHETDCKKYYECKRDEESGELVKIECECPDGQVWDDEGKYCNAEELSPPCDNNSSDSSYECKEEGYFRDPEDCTKYYHCNKTGENEYKKEHHQCDDGLVFDEEGRYCNAPELSEPCDDSSDGNDSSESSNGNDSSTSSSDNGSSDDGSSDDGSSDNGSSDGTTSSESSSGKDECTKEGFFRNSEDCTKYYQCSKNEETGELEKTDCQCPDGRVFDEGSNYCNEPELSEEPCESENNNDDTTSRQSNGSNGGSSNGSSSSGDTRKSGSGGDPECTEEGFFRHPDDCNKFYRCVDFSGSGESYTRYDFECPEGLHFDEVNLTCNWPTMTPPCENNRLRLLFKKFIS